MAFDTIAAIATPPGVGGVGIIRISGAHAVDVAGRVARGLDPDTPSHQLILRRLVDARGGVLDQALVVVMRGPRSFTGEDVVELHCHGGPVLLQMVLEAVLVAGARAAEAGEFTRRAFLHGRLDLVQAEAIADLVSAKSPASCRLAQRHLSGRLSRAIRDLRERLAHALSLVEAALDFSTEAHVYALDRDWLRRELDRLDADVLKLLASYDRGRLQREGVRCVIAGRPNAGKSSLLNALLEEERAIVSPVPGTTRDYIDAELQVDGLLFRLIDTAGLRVTTDPVEAEGSQRSRRLITEADLVLYVVDSSQPVSEEDLDAMRETDRLGVLIWNKVDLVPAGPPPPIPSRGWVGPVEVALTRQGGIEAVRRALRQVARAAGLVSAESSATLSRARHRDALERARAHLRVASSATEADLEEELIALDLRLALDAVGEVVGDVTPDDILGRIFAEFCIGK